MNIVNDESIVIVSGIPRSGTSMVMNMLSSGGLDIMTDHLRKADCDNPKGYYEYEKVKQLKNDITWLHHVKGKGIKIISQLLYFLPKTFSYKIIFVKRDMQEILASQRKMFERLQKKSDAIEDSVLAEKFGRHLENVEQWIDQEPNIRCLYINHRDIINNPLEQAKAIKAFLVLPLDVTKMAHSVEPELYRNRNE